MCHAGRKDALFGGLLDAVHGEVTKLEMVAHEKVVFCLGFEGRIGG